MATKRLFVSTNSRGRQSGINAKQILQNFPAIKIIEGDSTKRFVVDADAESEAELRRIGSEHLIIEEDILHKKYE